MTKQDEAREAFNAARTAIVNASEALEMAAEAAFAAYREAAEPEHEPDTQDRIDADAVRFGGDEFRRVRKCRIAWNEEDETWECDACGGAVGLVEVNYCENCGAKVVGE